MSDKKELRKKFHYEPKTVRPQHVSKLKKWTIIIVIIILVTMSLIYGINKI